MKKFDDRLLQITRGCRPDMHEPDEHGIKARIVGDHLDNAFGEDIRIEAIEGNFQEFVVILERDTNHGRKTEKFNLATLIALARLGARSKGFVEDF